MALLSPKSTPKHTKSKIKIIGRVTHFYSKIGVAIVDLAAPITVGDTVKFSSGDLTFVQDIASMHIDHQPVKKANKGQVVGIKVDFPIKEGALVLAA